MKDFLSPKAKAKLLVEKFSAYVDYQEDDCFSEKEKMIVNAKQCAIISVREIRMLHKKLPLSDLVYYVEVEKEIEKL
jgi:hypothetical protein